MNRKAVIFYSTLGLLTAVFLFRTIVASSAHVSYGQEMHALEKHRAELLEQKADLERKNAATLSLAELTKEAEANGYVPIQKIYHVGAVVASR